MGNALEFILKLSDQFTPAMRAAGSLGASISSRLQGSLGAVTGSSRQMSSSLSDLRSRLEAVNNTRLTTRFTDQFRTATAEAARLQQQIARLDNSSSTGGGRGGSMLGDIVGGNIVSNLIGKGVDMAKTAAMSIITGAAKQEQNVVGLTTFLGKEGAKTAYEGIKQDAAITPFDTQSLLMVNRALIASGLSAKAARNDAMNLANAVSAVGGGNEELSRMAVNMQQIKVLGKASALDIKQFGYAGLNIYKILSDSTGKSIDQVKGMEVTYDQLSKALEHARGKGGAYFGALEAQGKTLSGRWMTFVDNIQMKAADIGAKMMPAFTWVVDLGISLLGSFGSIETYLQPVFDILNNIPAIIESIKNPTGQWGQYISAIQSFVSATWETVKSLAGNIWNIVKGVVEWMGKSEILKDLFWFIGKLGEGLLTVVRGIGDAISWIWDNAIKPILNGIEWAYKAIKGLLGFGNKAEVQVTQTVKTAIPGAPAAGAGITPTGAPGGGGGSGAPSLAGAKEKSSAINSGGQRTITINIGKQIESFSIHTANVREGVDELGRMVKEELQRVLYSLNGAQTSGA